MGLLIPLQMVMDHFTENYRLESWTVTPAVDAVSSTLRIQWRKESGGPSMVPSTVPCTVPCTVHSRVYSRVEQVGAEGDSVQITHDKDTGTDIENCNNVRSASMDIMAASMEHDSNPETMESIQDPVVTSGLIFTDINTLPMEDREYNMTGAKVTTNDLQCRKVKDLGALGTNRDCDTPAAIETGSSMVNGVCDFKIGNDISGASSGRVRGNIETQMRNLEERDLNWKEQGNCELDMEKVGDETLRWREDTSGWCNIGGLRGSVSRRSSDKDTEIDMDEEEDNDRTRVEFNTSHSDEWKERGCKEKEFFSKKCFPIKIVDEKNYNPHHKQSEQIDGSSNGDEGTINRKQVVQHSGMLRDVDHPSALWSDVHECRHLREQMSKLRAAMLKLEQTTKGENETEQNGPDPGESFGTPRPMRKSLHRDPLEEIQLKYDLLRLEHELAFPDEHQTLASLADVRRGNGSVHDDVTGTDNSPQAADKCLSYISQLCEERVVRNKQRVRGGGLNKGRSLSSGAAGDTPPPAELSIGEFPSVVIKEDAAAGLGISSRIDPPDGSTTGSGVVGECEDGGLNETPQPVLNGNQRNVTQRQADHVISVGEPRDGNAGNRRLNAGAESLNIHPKNLVTRHSPFKPKTNEGFVEKIHTPILPCKTRTNEGLVEKIHTPILPCKTRTNEGLVDMIHTPILPCNTRGNEGLVDMIHTPILPCKPRSNEGGVDMINTPILPCKTRTNEGGVEIIHTPILPCKTRTNEGLVDMINTPILPCKPRSSEGGVEMNHTQIFSCESKNNKTRLRVDNPYKEVNLSGPGMVIPADDDLSPQQLSLFLRDELLELVDIGRADGNVTHIMEAEEDSDSLSYEDSDDELEGLKWEPGIGALTGAVNEHMVSIATRLTNDLHHRDCQGFAIRASQSQSPIRTTTAGAGTYTRADWSVNVRNARVTQDRACSGDISNTDSEGQQANKSCQASLISTIRQAGSYVNVTGQCGNLQYDPVNMGITSTGNTKRYGVTPQYDVGAVLQEEEIYLDLLSNIRHHKGRLAFSKIVVDWSTVKALRAQVGELCVFYLVSAKLCQFLTPRFGWEYVRHRDVISGKEDIDDVSVMENSASVWYEAEIRDMTDQTIEHIINTTEALTLVNSLRSD